MRKYLSLILLIVIFTPVLVNAQSTPCPPGTVCIENPLEADTFAELIDAIINIIFYLAIAIAPIMFIVAGFHFITAVGDPEKIKTAKRIILWTLIGLLVVISAKGLIMLFGEVFGVETPYNK